MMYIKFGLYAIPVLLLVLLTYVLALPLAAYSVVKNIDVLPYPWNLFHTHDDDLTDHWGSCDKCTGLWNKIKLVWYRMLWIMRNPAYGFKAYWFGIPSVGTKIIRKSPKFVLLVTEDGQEYFCYKDDYWTLGWAWWYQDRFMYKFGFQLKD